MSSKFGATPSRRAGATRRADGRGAAIHMSRERLGSMVAIGAGRGAHRGQRGAGANIPFSGCAFKPHLLPTASDNGEVWGGYGGRVLGDA